MRLKLGENLSHELTAVLTGMGHDVATVWGEGLSGRSDIVVGEVARQKSRVLFTLDVEFADVQKHAPGSHPGVVVFRPRRMGPLQVNRLVLWFMEQAELESLSRCVVVVDWERVRVRQPFPEMDV